MSQTTATARPRQPRQLPPVCGSVRVLQPVGSVSGPAHSQTGEIAINGKAYFCRCLEHGFQLFSYDQKRRQTTHYDLPADLSSCECPDYLTRRQRREDGRCKHQKALAALIRSGKLPALAPA